MKSARSKHLKTDTWRGCVLHHLKNVMFLGCTSIDSRELDIPSFIMSAWVYVFENKSSYLRMELLLMYIKRGYETQKIIAKAKSHKSGPIPDGHQL